MGIMKEIDIMIRRETPPEEGHKQMNTGDLIHKTYTMAQSLEQDRQIEKAGDYVGKLIIEQIRLGSTITQQDVDKARQIASMVYPVMIPEE